jgi:hypothetical protein
MEYGIKGYSIAVNKDDYDSVVVGHLDYADKYHYTWALRLLLAFLDQWKDGSNNAEPFEYIYDWMDPKAQKIPRQEIIDLMDQCEQEAIETGTPGQYTNWSFKRRQDIPALQCADALAWTCYQLGLFVHTQKPLTEIASECWKDYSSRESGNWLIANGITREQLAEWAIAEQSDGRSNAIIKEWMEKKSARVRKG